MKEVLGKDYEEALKGLPYGHFPENLCPESGFFAIIDFTEIKGMKYKGRIISTERDLLKFFYKTGRIRFLIGQSISWPYEDELVGRVSFAKDNKLLINALYQMNKAMQELKEKEDYIIRFNRIEDQSQMTKIKVNGWRNTYKEIVDKEYLEKLNVEEQTQKYFRSFEEYKDRVLVAVKGKEVLGYACFDPKEKNFKYDSELVSLYIKEEYQRKGIGKALFTEATKELISRNKRNMILWVFADNKNAITFYKKLGGIISETRQAKIGNKTYKEFGFYYDLESMDKDGSY